MARRVKLAGQVVAIATVAALFALLVWKVADANKGNAAAKLARGERPMAPEFELRLLTGSRTLRLSSLRGKGVVVNFWASWCIPCKAEMPRLQAAWERWRDDGLVVVGVNAQDFRSDARRFVRRYGVTFPVVHDRDASTLNAFGLTGFPETFFVARNGRLVGDRIQGEVSEEQLEENIRLALGRSS
jgi:cytochrome c biogenesis protein CcmG/thiol:disulfide interchange protein DsbE